jgi:hypothetical protein
VPPNIRIRTCPLKHRRLADASGFTRSGTALQVKAFGIVNAGLPTSSDLG